MLKGKAKVAPTCNSEGPQRGRLIREPCAAVARESLLTAWSAWLGAWSRRPTLDKQRSLCRPSRKDTFDWDDALQEGVPSAKESKGMVSLSGARAPRQTQTERRGSARLQRRDCSPDYLPFLHPPRSAVAQVARPERVASSMGLRVVRHRVFHSCFEEFRMYSRYK